MVSAVGARVQSKGSRRKTKPQLIPKRCMYCGRPYKGVAQSNYCSKTHTEQASRARKQALVDALTEFLYIHSESMTRAVKGIPAQATVAQARRKAEFCIEHFHTPFKLKLMALGYVYHEQSRSWLQQRYLAP